MAKNEEIDNPILKLLDPENNDPITLYDENEKPVEFEQIALIPYNEKLYAILKPIEKMDGVADDEAIVFSFEEDDNNEDQLLVVEESDAIIDEVFAIYNKLLDEQGAEEEK
ncbi:MAG: DUF1292 domain-containing protein [Clostridia bacterium]|nr:DUF1292 domain-containing protein [Clostridia bacterium]